MTTIAYLAIQRKIEAVSTYIVLHNEEFEKLTHRESTILRWQMKDLENLLFENTRDPESAEEEECEESENDIFELNM